MRTTIKKGQKTPILGVEGKCQGVREKGQKTPKIAQNEPKTPKMAKNTKKHQKWPKITKNAKVSILGGPPGGPPGAEKKCVTK